MLHCRRGRFCIKSYSTSASGKTKVGYRESFRKNIPVENVEFSDETLKVTVSNPKTSDVVKRFELEKSRKLFLETIQLQKSKKEQLSMNNSNYIMRKYVGTYVNSCKPRKTTKAVRNLDVLYKLIELQIKTKQKVTTQHARLYFNHLHTYPDVTKAKNLLSNLTRFHKNVKRSWIIKTMNICMACRSVSNACEIFDRLAVNYQNVKLLDKLIEFLIQNNEITLAEAYHKRFEAYHDSTWILIFRHFFALCQNECQVGKLFSTMRKYTLRPSVEFLQHIYPHLEKVITHPVFLKNIVSAAGVDHLNNLKPK
jgi:hypothetical protein